MKKAIILYILLLVTVTGCIKENLDDCETTLYFSYLGDGTKEIFPQKIEKVDMYIYNQNNVFVQKTVLNRKELNRQRGTTLNLPSGQYHIICWETPQRHTDKRRFILAKQPCRSPALFYERVDIDQ